MEINNSIPKPTILIQMKLHITLNEHTDIKTNL